MREYPLGSSRLLQDIDPTAASVAAAHWLQAAAGIAAEVADCHPTRVVLETDNIEALAVETPTLMLERLDSGEPRREVVTDLIKAAMTAAEGKLAHPDAGSTRSTMLSKRRNGSGQAMRNCLPD